MCVCAHAAPTSRAQQPNPHKQTGDIGPGLPGFEIDGGGGGGDASARRLEADGAAVGDGANGNGSPSAGDDNNADAHASGSGEPSRLRYTILDVPPLPQALLLGFQQYLVMLGSTVLIPSVVVPPMGGSSEDLAKVVCTIFFASGIVTLLQTLLGDRLPIVQGGSFAFISPALGAWGWGGGFVCLCYSFVCHLQAATHTHMLHPKHLSTHTHTKNTQPSRPTSRPRWRLRPRPSASATRCAS